MAKGGDAVAEKSGIKRRGFASLSSERMREIASAGGSAVPAEKRSFKNREIARKAGAKGGANTPNELRSFSVNPELAREAGRKGGAVKRRKAEEGGAAT